MEKTIEDRLQMIMRTIEDKVEENREDSGTQTTDL